MWPWQQSVLRKKHIFFLHIVGLITVVHTCIILGALLWQNQQKPQEFIIHEAYSAVVFLPLQKKVVQPNRKKTSIPTQKKKNAPARLSLQEYTHLQKQNKKPAQPTKTTEQTSSHNKTIAACPKTVSNNNTIPKKMSTTQKSLNTTPAKEQKKRNAPQEKKAKKPTVQEKNIDPAPHKKTMLSEKKPSSPNKNAKPQVLENKVPVKKQPSNLPKKKSTTPSAPVQKEQPQALSETKASVQNQDKPEKVLPKNTVHPNQTKAIPTHEAEHQVSEKSASSDQKPLAQPVPDSHETKEIDLSNVLFAGQEDLHNLEITNQLRTAIAPYWHPPKGMKPNTTCKVELYIDNKGSVQKTRIHTSSGSLAFDMKAKQAILTAQYPKTVHNRQIIISLGI